MLAMVLLLLLPGTSSHAGGQGEQRKAQYREKALRYTRENSDWGIRFMPILAYAKQPIPRAMLDGALSDEVTRGMSTFDLPILVRTAFLCDQYDREIRAVLRRLPYWMTRGDKLHSYNSENHMASWLCSGYLARQLLPGVDLRLGDNFDERLKHYLDLKVEYGFYEFFSTVYSQFTLGNLLNLADFAEDPAIRSRAEQAAQRMLREWLLLASDKGGYFPPAGRNYTSRYRDPEYRDTLWLASGFGDSRAQPDHAGAFISTSRINLDKAAAS